MREEREKPKEKPHFLGRGLLDAKAVVGYVAGILACWKHAFLNTW